MKRILVIVAAVFVLAAPASAFAHGPQPLPDAACTAARENANVEVAGTDKAHTSLGANAQGHDHIPHDFHPGLGCVHINPNAGH
jgi:hypothetical protein